MDAKAKAARIMSVRLQAEAGNPQAQASLAHAMLVGREVPRDFDQAIRLLNLACAAQHADALLLRSSLAIMGLAAARNYDEAFDFLKRAAATGNASAVRQLAVLADPRGRFNLDVWSAPANVTQQAKAPRIFTFKNFLPKSTCDYLISVASPHLIPATVRDPATGAALSVVRTNSAATWDALNTFPVVNLVNLRIAGVTGTSILNQEPINVLRYEIGQEYKPHYDFTSGENVKNFASELELLGQRVGTFLIYLNEGYGAGETEFPRLNWRFKGEPGDALFFWNVSAAGEPERASLHAGLPVTHGEKWLVSKWIRSKQVPLWWPER